MNLEYILYTDGSSRGNPGPGGWGSIISGNGKVTEIGGFENKTTNNRMELTALLEGLKYIALKKEKEKPKVSIFTDSSYAINGASKWIAGWKKNGWKTSQKTDVVNKDIWEELDEVLGKVQATWNHVKGHAGISGNERCDQIATAFADQSPMDLFDGDVRHYGINLTLPTPGQLDAPATLDRSRKQAYSYLSLIDGILQIHKTWSDCENRVKGESGAKFRKAISKEDELEILKDWGVE